jgi:hypothetical protein
MDNGGFSTRVKRPALEGDLSPPASAEVKNTWIYCDALLGNG